METRDLSYLDALGDYALRYVRPGQTLGLGTGYAAATFIRAVGARKIRIRGVATSNASAELALSLGIELVELREAPQLDAIFDGADEVDPRLNMIKGRGGAMVREKIVAAAARRRFYLVGYEKCVKHLGDRGNLPVEVVPFAAEFCQMRLRKLGLKPQLRMNGDGHEFISDNGNLVLNCGVKWIHNPARLERELCATPGVVGTGLFIGMAHIVLIASAEGKVSTLRAK